MNKIVSCLCLIHGLIVALWAASCDEPPMVRNSAMTVDTFNGTKVTYRCTTGRLFGEEALYCNASGQWHAPPPVCREMCGKPQQIEQALLQYPADQINAHAVGTKVFYRCTSGYHEELESICRPDFTWSDPSLVSISFSEESTHKEAWGSWTVPKVELSFPDWLVHLLRVFRRSHCPEPKVENGEIVSERKEKYNAEHAVAFQCSAGFRMEGSSFVTCAEDGSWKPELPRCVKYCRSSSQTSTMPQTNKFLYHGKKLEDLKPFLEWQKLSLQIQKLQLEIEQKSRANISCN